MLRRPVLIGRMVAPGITKLMTLSIKMAVKEEGLRPLYSRLEEAIPDISEQYCTGRLTETYHLTKVRAQHSFQVSLALEAMEMFDIKSVLDIGDSCGNHLVYLSTLSQNGLKVRSLNIDPRAVKKARAQGIEAEEADAERYHWSKADSDMLVCFEVLEHLVDPLKFLVGLRQAKPKCFVITCPYLRKSRISYEPLVSDNGVVINAEDAHIHELSPGDWKFLLYLAGWRVIKEKRYLQFPQRVFGWRVLADYWERVDFLGFWGCILS